MAEYHGAARAMGGCAIYVSVDPTRSTGRRDSLLNGRKM